MSEYDTANEHELCFQIGKLKQRIAELEDELKAGDEGYAYWLVDSNNEIRQLKSRIAELKVFINQLIEAGDNLDCVISVISTTVPYGDPYLEQSEWAALVRDWKEG